MASRFCLRILVALFHPYVTCLGNYEGSMPAADVQRVSAHTFPLTGPEMKQIRNWNDLSHSSSHQLQHQGSRGSYDDHHKENLFVGSNGKSDTKDCQTRAKSDSQENMINFKPSASVPKYGFSGFTQPSAQYESHPATNAFKNIQPHSHLASAPSASSGSTLMRTLKVPESKPLKASRGESSYGVPKTTGSSKAFVVNPPKNAYGHMEFNSEVTEDPFARGPNPGSTSILGQMSHQHGSSKGSQSIKVQTASSSYGPLLKGTSVYSSTKPIKQPYAGLKYTEATPLVVSSGPIFVVQGGGSAQGHGGYSGPPGYAKPLVPSYVDYYQSSQAPRNTRLTASSQGKRWKEPLHYSISGTPYSPNHEQRKPSENDCRDNIAKSIASSGEILLKSPESAQRNKLPPHYEATHPKIQQPYNSLGRPNQWFKPMYPSRSGAKQDVPQSSIASSGAILIMQAPTSVQGRTDSSKPKVHPSFSERKVTSASGQTAHQYQPFKVTQNSRSAQPATSTYASSSQTGHQAFSSVMGTLYKPNAGLSKPSTSVSGLRDTNLYIGGSNEINTVHVRLNKPSTSSFGHFQDQWASGDIRRGAFQSSLPPSYRDQRPGQNVPTPVSSSAPQYYGSKGVQSQFIVSQGNTDGTQVTTIPSGFGQGAIRRLSATLSSNYKQAEHNENQVNRLDSLAPKCEVTQNSYTGLGQQDSIKFQEVNLSV